MNEPRNCRILESWLVRGTPEAPGVLVHRLDEGEFGLQVPVSVCPVWPADGDFPESFGVRLSRGAVATIAALFSTTATEFSLAAGEEEAP